jgi:inosose dehydratase
MSKTTRRDFIKFAGLGAALSLSSSIRARANPGQEKSVREKKTLNLGMASYSFRQFNLEETLAMTKRLGLRRIALKSFHLPLESTEEQIKAVSEKVREQGLELYGCGVVYMRDEGEAERAFKYAKAAGIKVIIGSPSLELLGFINKKVQEFDISVAIHNHGPDDKLYPTPESVYEKVKNFDSRLGLCLDVGHTQRAGLDPSECARKFALRLLDVHIKDVTASSKEGTSVEVGRGVVDIPKLLATLLKLNYPGTVALEYEKDEKDPLPGAAESVGFIRGVLAML